MRIWTVHLRDGAAPAERAEGAVLVKDGWSWPGLLIPLPWLLFRRLWLGAAIYGGISVAAATAASLLPLDENAAMVLALLGNVFAALEGNDLRRRKLRRLGYSEAGSVLGKSHADAEIAFFSGSMSGEPALRAAAPAARAHAARMPHPAANPVLGLFPRPENGR